MRRLLVAITTLVAPAVSTAQGIAAADIRRIDSVFVSVDRTDSPGCALGIFQGGRITYSHGYGMASLEHGLVITPRTVFDIGSTSKQFAAAAVALLAQDGKLTLDDEVRRHIPEMPAYQKPVTIRHLLNHTSGIRDYLQLMAMRNTNFDGVTTDRDALDLILRQRALNFDPGSEFLYSNSGYFLLSEIVKRVSGRTLRQFAEERIFGPLGMHRTHFHDDHTMIVANRATAYSPGRGGFVIDMSGFEQTGDGAVNTSVEELLSWDSNFYTPTVGGARLLADLHTQGVLTSGRTIDYALGLFVDQHRGLRRVRHGGAWAGYRAELLRFPEARTSVAVLCNLGSANPSALADAVANIVLRERLGAVTASAAGRAAAATVTLTAAQLERLAGHYRDPATGEVRVITVRDGQLVTSRAPVTFLPTDSLTFAYQGAATMAFALGADGRATRLTETVLTSGAQPFERFTPVTLTSADQQAYAGTYYVDELDATFVVGTDSAGLVVRMAGGPPQRLTPTVRDAFTDGGTLGMNFTRDPKGRVVRLAASSGRVRGLEGTRR